MNPVPHSLSTTAFLQLSTLLFLFFSHVVRAGLLGEDDAGVDFVGEEGAEADFDYDLLLPHIEEQALVENVHGKASDIADLVSTGGGGGSSSEVQPASLAEDTLLDRSQTAPRRQLGHSSRRLSHLHGVAHADAQADATSRIEERTQTLESAHAEHRHLLEAAAAAAVEVFRTESESSSSAQTEHENLLESHNLLEADEAKQEPPPAIIPLPPPGDAPQIIDLSAPPPPAEDEPAPLPKADAPDAKEGKRAPFYGDPPRGLARMMSEANDHHHLHGHHARNWYYYDYYHGSLDILANNFLRRYDDHPHHHDHRWHR